MIARGDGHVRVRMMPAEACARCARGEGCGAGVFTRLFARRTVILDLPDTTDAMPGDRIQVGVTASMLGRAASAVYGLPLAAFLLAAGLMTILSGQPAGTLAGDGLALAAGLAAGWGMFRLSAAGLPRYLSPVMRETPAACDSQTAGALESAPSDFHL